MKKFEYLCKRIYGDGEKTTVGLNKLGQEGWELVAAHEGSWMYFKREIKE